MEKYKKLVLLHSNDMHGDFFAEDIDNKLVGGVSMLSGYINKVKQEEKNVLYCVAGDMFRGSVIDSESQGISTIEIMNMLAPDVVTIGNHEVDYGLSHLLFIEKCAKFPIINSNLYIKLNGSRLFEPYHIVEIDGMKVLFIGILTEDVISKTKTEAVIGSLVDVNDAAKEIGKICNTFNGVDIDFTVLLTHIGYKQDIELAKKLDPAWGVDVIIGGHSHTFLDEPTKVNDILIVQAGTGTDQIGRFDIVVDTDNNNVASYKWEAIPINANTCPRDERIEKLVSNLKSQIDLKYGKVLRRLSTELEHNDRFRQTTMGSFISDIFKMAFKVDINLSGSGSIRSKKLGPIITLNDMMDCYPYNEAIYKLVINGKQLRKMFMYIYRDEVWTSDDSEFYQISEGLHTEYCKSKKELSIKYNGNEVKDDDVFNVSIRNFDYQNFEKFFGIPLKDVKEDGILCTDSTDVLYEYLDSDESLPVYPIDDRQIITD